MSRIAKPYRPLVPEDVTGEYLDAAEPGRGAITYEEGYKIAGHQDEIEIADWLYRTFGGNIKLLTESAERGIKMPDYIWRERKWELKGTHSINSADKSLRYALKQTQDNPGGVILNVLENMDMAKLEGQILRRFLRSNINLLDVMILSKGELLKIIRYEK